MKNFRFLAKVLIFNISASQDDGISLIKTFFRLYSMIYDTQLGFGWTKTQCCIKHLFISASMKQEAFVWVVVLCYWMKLNDVCHAYKQKSSFYFFSINVS